MGERVTALAHSIGRRKTRAEALAWDLALIVGGAAFIWLMTQVKISLLPFSPVPITGQTLAVLTVGGALGTLRGGTTILLYLGLAVAGLPHASATGETGIRLFYASSPTGGYLLGWLLAAVIVGFLCERGWDRSLGSSIGAMLLGSIAIYLIGVPWLANAAGYSAPVALEKGLYPFIIGDMIKLLIAAGLLPTAWKLVKKT
jgi:biotin transport system substrate-specific component